MSDVKAATESLISALAKDASLRRQLRVAPMEALAKYNLKGDEAAAVFGKLVMGELRVPGYGRSGPIRILSPWPPEGQHGRRILRLEPSTVPANTEVLIRIRARGLKDGDGVMCRHDEVAPFEFYAREVDVDPAANEISGLIKLPEKRLYDVYIGQDKPGEFGGRRMALQVV